MPDPPPCLRELTELAASISRALPDVDVRDASELPDALAKLRSGPILDPDGAPRLDVD